MIMYAKHRLTLENLTGASFGCMIISIVDRSIVAVGEEPVNITVNRSAFSGI